MSKHRKRFKEVETGLRVLKVNPSPPLRTKSPSLHFNVIPSPLSTPVQNRELRFAPFSILLRYPPLPIKYTQTADPLKSL